MFCFACWLWQNPRRWLMGPLAAPCNCFSRLLASNLSIAVYNDKYTWFFPREKTGDENDKKQPCQRYVLYCILLLFLGMATAYTIAHIYVYNVYCFLVEDSHTQTWPTVMAGNLLELTLSHISLFNFNHFRLLLSGEINSFFSIILFFSSQSLSLRSLSAVSLCNLPSFYLV